MQICSVVDAIVSKILNSLLSCWTSVAWYVAALLCSHSHGNYWNKSLEEGAPPWSFFSLKIFNMNQLLLQLLNNKSCPKLLSSDCELFQPKKVQHNGYSLIFYENNMTTWTQHEHWKCNVILAALGKGGYTSYVKNRLWRILIGYLKTPFQLHVLN